MQPNKKSTKDTREKKKKYEEEVFVDTSKPVWNYSLLTDEDELNYQQGTHHYTKNLVRMLCR